ncbi:MAG: EAL domain-containing protein [Magnetococcales bacterium]|nr:EAL domain-containing protein [Magnetococcales bacterium]
MDNSLGNSTERLGVVAPVMRHGARSWTRFQDYALSSVFQPIFSLAHRRVVGYEALLRANDGQGRAVPPLALFETAHHAGVSTPLDRAARTLHVENFAAQNRSEQWLFLNFNPHTIHEGSRQGEYITRQLLETHRMPPRRLVVEILEKEIHDEGALKAWIGYYRALGCLVAVDDFGAGSSNFDRIWKIKPDIVKLDRSLILNASANPMARRMLAPLVSLLHEAECLVLIEGVENEAQAMMALDADVDMVQGFYFARPEAGLDSGENGVESIDRLSTKQRGVDRRDSAHQWSLLSDYIEEFWRRANQAHGEVDPSALFQPWDEVRRCYVLDDRGRQITANLGDDLISAWNALRYAPIADARGADWSRRAYFRRALRQPGEVQITGPYFSMPDANMCVTLSVALPHEGGTRVYCTDLLWNDIARADLITGSYCARLA